MADFNLDRIRFRWKGDWALSTEYVKDDIVLFQGKTYVCVVGHRSDGTWIYPDLTDALPKWELMFDGNQWRGDWTFTTYYHRGELVKFNGYIYQCLTEHQSTNVVSQGIIDDIDNWTIVATTYNWLNTWTPSTPAIGEEPGIPTYYNLGDVIIYNGITYICIQKHIAATSVNLGLENDQSKWAIVTRSDNWRSVWTTNTRYIVDDIVKYGAITYRCITSHTSSADETDGLEFDQLKWEIFLEGIEYKGDWTITTRYKKYDVVKYGGALWRANQGHISSSSLRADQVRWDIWVPGFEYENIWTADTEYNKGDIVVYGGYSYTALTNNTNSVPSVNGLLQDTGDWELLKQGYKHLGDWNAAIDYKTGDVIRDQGYLYIAIRDNANTKPDTDDSIWQILVTGRKWKNNWIDNTEYHLGDVVTYAGVAYICVQRHLGTESDNRPDLDIENTKDNYWIVLLQGTASNVLTTRGDLRTHDGSNTVRYAIGSPGNVLKTINGQITWENFEEVPNVFFVSISGSDTIGAGLTINAPFRTVKYACEYIANNVDTNTTNTTVFIKTGIYEEALPITIPRNCALVGDELRSTVIQPASSYEASNMFYVNNGSGIRNMTLQGLTGTLGAPNQYLTRRPTAGAFVSLDPGTGPDDETIWITTKSPYVQNVTTFGTGCVGMKIDGSLHNGGNKSVVANDFTQVLSDGIGYWATDGGRSELVSVFTYFCHIGYLAEHGGILRATNGNNSYGTYGSVAEGFDQNETPITAKIDNRTLEAQISVVHTDGNQVLGVGFTHNGQEYTSATGAVVGTGINADAVFNEVRNSSISQIRVIDPADSSIPGGLNYQYLLNNAQSGNTTSITLAASDETGTAEKYVGMRVFIDSGAGVGQYAVITGYDALTKVAIVSKESDGSAGWEHIYPGWPIETTLDSTTRYKIEPAVSIDEPGFSSSSLVAPDSLSWTHIESNGSNNLIAVAEPSDNYSYSIDGGTTWIGAGYDTTWTAGTTSIVDIVHTGERFVIAGNTGDVFTTNLDLHTFATKNVLASNIVSLASDGNGRVLVVQDDNFVYRSVDHGLNFLLLSSVTAGKIAYGFDRWIVVANDGTVGYSDNGGANWTTTTSAISARTWNEVIFGNGRFVAISAADNVVARSFDGITWYESTIETDETLNRLSYGAGVFLASGGSTKLATSKGGETWSTFTEDSTVYTTSISGTWTGSTYSFANDNFILLNSDLLVGQEWNVIETGATAFARVNVSSSRIQDFIIYDPGSNYTTDPVITIYDPEATVYVDYQVRRADGVLAQPTFTNRGQGYVTATMTITGDGFADIYQTGKTLKLKNVSLVPGPGANVVINGIDDVTYRLTKILSQSGAAPNFDLIITVSPTITNQNSPEHEETIIIREQYSQIRLTGHDFLDIGTGNTNSTRYPQLYLEGEDAENARQPFNETVDAGGGRVFYTSTDQDGNFRVGELFAVEQATGIVTVNADLFELSGLTELSLGGIQVGGSSVVIKEFSKDGTFVANSNNIVPTQAAIIKYLESRISSGGADALTNTLIAGQVRISSTNITTTSGLQINIPVPVHHTKGIDGDYLSLQYFGI